MNAILSLLAYSREKVKGQWDLEVHKPVLVIVTVMVTIIVVIIVVPAITPQTQYEGF